MQYKNIIISLLFIVSTFSIYSQIGINTENPLKIFHIDGGSDGSATAAQIANDVVIDANGNLGLGTINPLAKLDIQGKMRLQDGNEQIDKVLVSDAAGKAGWDIRPKLEVIEVPNVASTLSSITMVASVPIYTGLSITLTPGKWQVVFTSAFSGGPVYCFWDLSTSNTTHVISDMANCRAMSGGSSGSVSAVYFVHPTQSTTFYLWATSTGNTSFSNTGAMWAFPIGDYEP